MSVSGRLESLRDSFKDAQTGLTSKWVPYYESIP